MEPSAELVKALSPPPFVAPPKSAGNPVAVT